jgi:hypothetical protein
VIETTLRDPHAAREFLRGLLDASPAGTATPDEAEWLRVPVAAERGQVITARVLFEAPLKPAHISRLGRVLQRMGEAMEEQTDSQCGHSL